MLEKKLLQKVKLRDTTTQRSHNTDAEKEVITSQRDSHNIDTGKVVTASQKEINQLNP